MKASTRAASIGIPFLTYRPFALRMITVEFCGVPSPPHPECNSIFRTDLVVDWPDTMPFSAQIINIAIQTCFIRRLDTDKSLLAPNGAFSAK